MLIVGAGMAGLLAAAMLRNDCCGIIESQKALPNNHSALLRFRTSIVGDALNIPFRKVPVLKAVWTPYRNPVADALAYSRKTTGQFSLRSSVSVDGDIVERFIAPPDLIEQMRDRLMCPVEFDTDFDDCWAEIKGQEEHEEIISTMPMPRLMAVLGYQGERPDFRYVSGFNINFTVADCDAFVSLYVPDPGIGFSRASITGSRVTLEFQRPGKTVTIDELDEQTEAERDAVSIACQFLGGLPIPDHWETKVQTYSKILPVDDALRKRFMLWATEEHGVYSLGRFATWRPGLLLDDLVKDVRVILDISRNGTYAMRRSIL